MQRTIKEEERAKIVADTFRAIVEHIEEGGSYRHLIYDRLGFSPEYYATLIDGLTISNTICDLEEYKKKAEKSENRYNAIKILEKRCIDLSVQAQEYFDKWVEELYEVEE